MERARTKAMRASMLQAGEIGPVRFVDHDRQPETVCS